MIKIAPESKHLTKEEQNTLHSVLSKYEFLFSGTLTTWKMKTIYIELHPGAKPYHDKSYSVPRAN